MLLSMNFVEKIRLFVLMAVGCLALSGCGGGGIEHTDAGHDHDHDHDHAHHHHHEPPHGGVGVVLGQEEFHLELLLDNANATLSVYVLDGHMENFVRIESPGFIMKLTTLDKTADLKMEAQASPRTGETVGDTSQFSGTDPILETAVEFDVVIPSLTIKGNTYADIKFSFPDGNE